MNAKIYPLKNYEVELESPQSVVNVLGQNAVYYSRVFSEPVEKFSFNTFSFYPVLAVSIPNAKSMKLGEIKVPKYKVPKVIKNGLKVVLNPKLRGGTPARIFPEKKLIEISPDFQNFSHWQKIFILYHEQAHLHTLEEEEADKIALKWYIQAGGNFSQAFRTLENTLSASPQRLERMRNIFNLALKDD